MTRFYSIASDMRITGGPAAYASARAGTGGLLSDDGQDIRVGQAASGPYVYRGYVKFDTTAIMTASTITSCSLAMVVEQDNSTTDFAIKIQEYDWKTVPDGTGTGSNRQAVFQLGTSGSNVGVAAQLATVLATPTTSGKAAGSTITWNLATSAFVLISKTGMTGFMFISSEDLGNSAPTNNEWIKMYSRDDTANAAYWPSLNVEYGAGSGAGGMTATIHTNVLAPSPFGRL